MKWFALLFSCCIATASAADSLPPSIQKALANAKIPSSALSLAIVPLDAKSKPQFFNADQPVNPASTMKLLTTYAGLNLLGPAYQWSTELRSSGQIINGVLNGDVYLKGSGDPKLTLERIWLLLRDLKAQGVREIRGDLVLDRSFFTLGAETAGFDDDSNDAERPYLVSPDALLLSFKSVRVAIKADNNSINILIDPALPELSIDNQLKIEPPRDCTWWRSKVDIQVEDSGGRAQIKLKGSIPANCAGERYVSVLDHPTFAASLLRTLWRESGGAWQGQVRQGVTPLDIPLLATSSSSPLPLVLRDINKYSNNLMARQLFLTLGALYGSSADGEETATRAAHVIQHWVTSRGWQFPELVLENGAGLSREERISARHLADLLRDAARSSLAAEFVSSLPLLGEDGTMRKRLLGESIAGRAHIKTGTLKDVRAIAGYVHTSAAGDYVVVAILNHPRAANGVDVLDEVLRYVYQ